MWKRIISDGGIWTLATYALVRGKRKHQNYADAIAGCVAILTAARLYRRWKF